MLNTEFKSVIPVFIFSVTPIFTQGSQRLILASEWLIYTLQSTLVR